MCLSSVSRPEGGLYRGTACAFEVPLPATSCDAYFVCTQSEFGHLEMHPEAAGSPEVHPPPSAGEL